MPDLPRLLEKVRAVAVEEKGSEKSPLPKEKDCNTALFKGNKIKLNKTKHTAKPLWQQQQLTKQKKVTWPKQKMSTSASFWFCFKLGQISKVENQEDLKSRLYNIFLSFPAMTQQQKEGLTNNNSLAIGILRLTFHFPPLLLSTLINSHSSLSLILIVILPVVIKHTQIPHPPQCPLFFFPTNPPSFLPTNPGLSIATCFLFSLSVKCHQIYCVQQLIAALLPSLSLANLAKE